MKVRIKVLPREREIDGVRLDHFERGCVSEVSSSVGAWLITEGYAEPEMRHQSRDEDRETSGLSRPRDHSNDHHHRRRRTDV